MSQCHCINCRKPMEAGAKVEQFPLCQSCKDALGRSNALLKTGISVLYKNGATVVYKDKQ